MVWREAQCFLYNHTHLGQVLLALSPVGTWGLDMALQGKIGELFFC